MQFSKKMIVPLLLAASLGCVEAHAAPPVKAAQSAAKRPDAGIARTSFQYATKDGQALYLERFVDNSVKVEGKRPVLLYSFGGGWEEGRRVDPLSEPYLKYFAERGYVVVAIDYRLGIKEAKTGAISIPAR